MNAREIGVFTPQDAYDIKDKVLGGAVTNTSVMRHGNRSKAGWHYGILTTDLEAASDPLTGWTQAVANPLMYVTNQDSLDMNEVTGVVNEKTVTNRSPNISGLIGDVVLFRWVVKEWVVVWCSSTTTYRHGIVKASNGCGYYEIELGVWIGDLSTEADGSVASSSITNPCNVCFNVVNEGTSACGIELTYPEAPVVGLGTYVNAYHRASSIVPLKLNTACLLLPPLAVDDVGSASSGTVPTWQIIDGLQEHTVQYEEEWDCCDGVDETGIETLLYRTPIVFAALVCPRISCGTCSDTSSV